MNQIAPTPAGHPMAKDTSGRSSAVFWQTKKPGPIRFDARATVNPGRLGKGNIAHPISFSCCRRTLANSP